MWLQLACVPPSVLHEEKTPPCLGWFPPDLTIPTKSRLSPQAPHPNHPSLNPPAVPYKPLGGAVGTNGGRPELRCCWKGGQAWG